MPFGIGPLELVIVLLIILVIFGPKRLPGLGRSLGTGMREFKDSVTGRDRGDADGEADPEPQQLPSGDLADRPPAARRAADSEDAASAFGRND